MRYKYYRDIVENNEDTITNILRNRSVKNIKEYLNLSDKNIYEPELLGKDKLDAGVALLAEAIKGKKYVYCVVDVDCDGFTSSSLLVNYLWQIWPNWVENNLEILFHTGKQHGLDDELMDYILDRSAIVPALVILPDSGSEQTEQHKLLKENNINVLSLDHHPCDIVSDFAIVINNQMCDYPNKSASGVCITWQFCRYIDKLLGLNFADEFIDLVALGLCGDNMSLLSLETRWLITKGFKEENIKNPFIYHMWQKNKFKLGEEITNWGAAFYIVPFINAVCRSGTQEEKQLLFNSMLNFRAFDNVLSNKRGHQQNEEEMLFEQCLRMVINVKNRQTKAEQQGLELLEERIKENDMMNKHKVLLFTFNSNEIDRDIAGLVANKVMGKYQRPCCILFKTKIDNAPWEEPVETIYAGSMRGCPGINFKDICYKANTEAEVHGHQNAAGLFIKESKIEEFLNNTDKLLKDLNIEPVYMVDYVFYDKNVNSQVIKDIASMNYFWGADMPESLVAIDNIKINKDNVIIYKKSSNTLKIILDEIDLLMFNISDELCKELENSKENKEICVVGTCHINEWNGNTTPQIYIKDIEIKKKKKKWNLAFDF